MSERLGAPHLSALAERYVDARELAEIMGVSTRTITRLVAEGMPSETWGLKRTRRFLPSCAIQWAQGRSSTISLSRDRDDDAPETHNRRE